VRASARARNLGQAALFLCLLSARAPAETVVWYGFEGGKPGDLVCGIEPVKDSGPAGLHGTPRVQSSVTYVPGIAPDSQVALDFDDLSDWIFVPDNHRLQLTRSLTLEAWVLVRDYQTSAVGNFIVFRGDTRGGMDPYQLSVDSHTHELRFMVYGPGLPQGDSLEQLRTPFRWLNEAIHVAGVLNHKTGFMGLYVNGELLASKHTPVRSLGPLNPAEHAGLGLGGFYDGRASFSLNGTLDEVRISNVALKPQQFLCQPRARPPEP
jgi:hypothetical protein